MSRLSGYASAGGAQIFRGVDRAAHLAGRSLGRVDVLARRYHRTWLVLGVLILADWLVTADVARIAAHRSQNVKRAVTGELATRWQTAY